MPSTDYLRDNFQGSQIDHVNVTVTDVRATAAVWEPALATLGIRKLLDFPAPADGSRPHMTGFGSDRKPSFWLVEGDTVDPNLHIAFAAPSREHVRRFHEAALNAGARNKLDPAVHTEYHENYYGGFVLDPDGINLEAVCHTE
ncbi:VOC family protein [Actinomycetes bacterium M1A6_2h]